MVYGSWETREKDYCADQNDIPVCLPHKSGVYKIEKHDVGNFTRLRDITWIEQSRQSENRIRRFLFGLCLFGLPRKESSLIRTGWMSTCCISKAILCGPL